MAVLDLDDALTAAENISDPEKLSLPRLSGEMMVKSKLIYSIIIQSVSGRALGLTRLVQIGSGFEAWHSLVKEYEPFSQQRKLAMLLGILNPDWHAHGRTFMDGLIAWERAVLDYETLTSTRVPDDFRIAVITRFAPVQVREWMRTADASALATYESVSKKCRVELRASWTSI
jgi:hypothetical protein